MVPATGQPGHESLDFTNLEFRFLIPPSLFSPAVLMLPWGLSYMQALAWMHGLCILMEVRPELKSFTGLRSEAQ